MEELNSSYIAENYAMHQRNVRRRQIFFLFLLVLCGIFRQKSGKGGICSW